VSDHLVRCLLGQRPIRVVAALTTATSREASRRHDLDPGARVAVARAATAGLLLATLTKGNERVTVQLLGNGSLGSLSVDANDAGEVRAYVRNPTAAIEVPVGERAALGPAVGTEGLVTVLRDLGLKEVFRGQCSITSGEVDEDVEGYLTDSEQVESALGCDARVDAGLDLVAAGGVLIQCLPDAARSADVVGELRERMRGEGVFRALERGPRDAIELAQMVLGELGDELIPLDQRPVRFACPCSRERVMGMLALLSGEELRSMIRDDGGAQIRCDFCAHTYEVSAAEIDDVLATRD
jgi:molecular chaperone Hsp33